MARKATKQVKRHYLTKQEKSLSNKPSLSSLTKRVSTLFRTKKPSEKELGPTSRSPIPLDRSKSPLPQNLAYGRSPRSPTLLPPGPETAEEGDISSTQTPTVLITKDDYENLVRENERLKGEIEVLRSSDNLASEVWESDPWRLEMLDKFVK